MLRNKRTAGIAPTPQINSRSRAVKVARGRVPTYSEHTADTAADMLAQALHDAGVPVPPDPIADARADTVANAHVRLRALISTVIGHVPSKRQKAKRGRTDDDTEMHDDAIEDEGRSEDPMLDNDEELQAAEARRDGKRVVSAIPLHNMLVF
jgi:hypothetical protein